MGVLVTSAGNSSSLLLLLLCSHLSLSASPGVLEQILEMKGKKAVFSHCYLRVLVITTGSKAKRSCKHREMKCWNSV